MGWPVWWGCTLLELRSILSATSIFVIGVLVYVPNVTLYLCRLSHQNLVINIRQIVYT
jgi:hypothetical protein